MSSIDQPISRKDAARLIGRTVQWLAVLERRGYVTRLDRGVYDPIAVVAGHAKFLIEDRRTTLQSAAAARLADAKAKLAELRAEREAGRLAPIAGLRSTAIEVFSPLFQDLDGVPAAFSRDLIVRKKLQALIDAARTRFCDRLDAETGKAA